MSVVALRPVTLGGSTAAAACGVHPYESPIELWARLTGRLPEVEESEAMRWGTVMEPVIMQELLDGGHELWHAEDFENDCGDDARPWLVGHPDAYSTANDARAVLEIKTCSPFAWPHDGTVPVHYAVQCQTYMHLTGLDRALLAVLVGGQKLELRTIDRDDKQIALILGLMEQFMGYVARDEPPPPIGSADERDAIRDLHPSSNGTSVRLAGAEWKAYQDLCGYRDQRDRLDALIREREAVVKLAMGDAETALSPSDRVVATWRSHPRTAVDVKLLKESRPELASLFTTTTETRRFNVL